MMKKVIASESLRLRELLCGGDKYALARAITLVESGRLADRALADALLAALPPSHPNSLRIGITGVPGAGKSTFIAALGDYLLANTKHKIAILTYDPSSPTSGGSVLGDRWRMADLKHKERLFIRPSPSKGHLGGIGSAAYESIALCEAAHFDLIGIETLGVGQQEMQIKDIVDICVLLLLPNTGDEIQGLKRGILEAADMILIHKADGSAADAAEKMRLTYTRMSALWGNTHRDWTPPVLCVSSLEKKGIKNTWTHIEKLKAHLIQQGFFQSQRLAQQKEAFEHYCAVYLQAAALQNPAFRRAKARCLKHIQTHPQSAPRVLARHLIQKHITAKPTPT